MSDEQSIELAVHTSLPASTSTVFEYPDDQLVAPDAPLRNESALPPVDEGFGAWSFVCSARLNTPQLAAAFVIEAIVWGLPTSFGVFLEAYLKDPIYASQKNSLTILPLIGNLSSGIMYCSGPVIYPITARYPQHRKTALWIGAFLSWASLFASSYTNRVVPLLLLQGGLYGIAGALLYAPCISYMSEWFVNKRGLANGIIFAGTAAGGLVFPLTIPALIDAHGINKSLRILSIIIAVFLFPLLPFFRGRLPNAAARSYGPGPRGASEKPWLRSWYFWTLMAVNTCQGFAYFVPIVWLPTFATEIHLSRTNASAALALLNGASLLGRLSLGYLSDSWDPWLLGLALLIVSSFATFVLWGVLANTLMGLMAFGLVYGMIAGGWSSLWTGFVRPMAKEDPTLATSLFGYLLLSRGLGNIFSTPISSALANTTRAVMSSASTTGYKVAGGRFEKMIVYVGTCFAASAILAVVGWLSERKRRAASRS